MTHAVAKIFALNINANWSTVRSNIFALSISFCVSFVNILDSQHATASLSLAFVYANDKNFTIRMVAWLLKLMWKYHLLTLSSAWRRWKMTENERVNEEKKAPKRVQTNESTWRCIFISNCFYGVNWHICV